LFIASAKKPEKLANPMGISKQSKKPFKADLHRLTRNPGCENPFN